jgi:hypothetical protein
MEVRGNDFGREDADAGREAAVERAVQVGGWDGRCEDKTGDLGEGVDSGVCATGALREDALADGAMEGIGEQALDGRQVGLNLPASVRRSIVGEHELPVGHGDAFRPNQQAGRGHRMHGITKGQGRGSRCKL